MENQMATNKSAEEMMLNALEELLNADPPASQLLVKFQNAFLALGSETPDNLEAVEQFNLIKNGDRVGIGVRGGQCLLTDIAWSMEDIELPSIIAERFPDLTEQDWEAYQRFITVLISITTSRRL